MPENLAPPPPPRPLLRYIFIGTDGLRAGWGIVLFLLPFSGLYLIGWLALHYHLVPASQTQATAAQNLTPGVAAFGEAFTFAIVAVSALVLSLIERRPFPRYGLGLRRALPDFATGCGWGLAALSILIGGLWATHTIRFDGLALHGLGVWSYGFKWAFAFLLVGLFEEFFFRGYLQYTLARGVSGVARTLWPQSPHTHAIGFWTAAFVLSGCVFAGTHTSNHGETFTGILAVALAGAIFVFSLWRTGSLWWAVGFHTAWDWAQSYLYGTPDSGNLGQGHLLPTPPVGSAQLSGGPAGPEGSLLVIPVWALVLLVIHVTLPRRDYPLTPDQSPPEKMLPHPQSIV